MRYFCVYFLLIISFFSFADEGEKVLTVGVYPASKLFSTDMESLLKRAIENAGFKVEFIELPEERSRRMANIGKIDGDIRRNFYGIDGYDNLLPLSASWGSDDIYLIMASNKDCIPPSQLSKYKPVGLLGVGYFNWAYELSDVGFEQADTVSAVMKMIILGRADYALIPEHLIPIIFKDLNGQLKKCGKQPILSLPNHAVFHVKHADKLDAISDELRKLMIVK